MKTAVIKNRQREHERFEAFENERRYTDEVTDMSERLAAPMRNTFEYEMRADGELWFQGEPLSKIFDKGIEVAEALVLENPQFTTELIRRRLERQEYDAMRELALGSEGDPDLLLVLSPIPDAVLAGLQLNAYDLERKKTLARIFRRTETGIEATSLSLDLSDRDGLGAIAARFGKTIGPDATSEDILAMRFVAYGDELSGRPVTAIRSLYDEALADKYGGEWYAGRQSTRITDAKEFVEEQSDLLVLHMAELEKLRATHSGRALEVQLELARYNLAAALARRLRGDNDAGSLADAGQAARVNGERYDGDCPTGIMQSAQTEATKTKVGEMKWMNCPFCGLATYGDPCAARLVCNACSAEVNNGVVVSKGIGRKNALTLKEHIKARRKIVAPEPKKPRLKQDRDSSTIERREVRIGGIDVVVYDRNTGVAIGKKS